MINLFSIHILIHMSSNAKIFLYQNSDNDFIDMRNIHDENIKLFQLT